nr:neuronatin isoform X4 [Vicugna pacos]
MAAVAAASAELLIIGWYIFRVLLQCRGRHRTPLPVPCALLLALDPSQCARPGTKSSGAAGASRGRSPRLLATKVVFLECCIYWVGFAFRNPPGTQPIARSVQVLPAEAGVHCVENRAACAGRAPPPGPQLRLQPPPLGGRVTRCSCEIPPAWEPMPHRNGGSPLPSRQRSTCQGQ